MNTMIRASFLLALISGFGQAQVFELDSDELFARGRELAFNGRRDSARFLFRLALQKSPDYADVRIFLARTYAWDGQHDSSRHEFAIVLQKEPGNQDALSGAIDNESWNDEYDKALALCNRALRYYPANEEFLLKKAKLLFWQQKDDESIAVLEKLFMLNKENRAAVDLRRAISVQSSKYTIGADYSYEHYERIYDPMQYASLSLGKRTSLGSLIGRLNYSHRFGGEGYQGEVDFYPGIADGMYAYVNYGYSGSSLFPKHRLGAEFFTMLPASFEASIGTRFLYFDASSTVIIYTGSVGWYVSDYWISLRTYITPWEFSNGVIDISRSLNLTVRYYFSDPESYLSIRGGGGFSPDQRRVQSQSGMSGTEIFLLKSQSVNIGWQQVISPFVLLLVNADYSHQELSFSLGEYVNVYSISAGCKVKL